ncbi:DUF1642 domain-containing protein [Lactococcus lactis]|uniref:DUF1642 domain-containing protein n=1 Tax=Lactococcus lactis TaxID=1358 RepID=UPI001D18EFAD|nr:DUF1642 domain-containing protein [Lactococcus lactis]MCC4121343.1 DUF1642 domain-containing protein [Lactococcus lactis]
MTRKDYIEKITQNLEHLTKDELKDVSILTTAQLGVRSKFSERQQLEKEIANLTPQLQQQALPVVPECVGKTVELLKKYPNSSWTTLYDSLSEEGVIWLNEYQQKDEKFGFGELNNKLFVLFHLAINGYTVEKPQLFYLKHIDMSQRSRYFDFYLEHDVDEFLKHQQVDKGKEPGTGFNKGFYTFTQQEIDDMQTGSYEQIPVPVEDGE